MKTRNNKNDIDFSRPLGIESGFFNQQLPAPPLAVPRSSRMSRTAKAMIGAFVIALVASVSVVALALTLEEEDPVEAAKWRTINEVKAKLAVIKARLAAEAEAEPVEPVEAVEAVEAVELVESASAGPTAGSSSLKVKKPVEKKPVEKKPVEKKPVEKKPVEKKPVDPKPQDELDKLLNPEKKPSLPKTLTRDQVQAGMSKVAGSVKSCGQGGSISTRVTISGNGKVSGVQILGPHAGTPTGSCAARYIRRASFPRFSDPSLRVKYPFSL